MKKKGFRIGVLIDQLIPGGVQNAAINEVLYLNKLGFEATLLVLEKSNIRPKNIPVTFISENFPKLFQKSLKIPFFHFLSTSHLSSPVLSLFSKLEFDLVISHGTTTSFTANFLKRFNNIPYLIIIHDPMNYILEKVYSKTLLRTFYPLIKPVTSFIEKRLIQDSAGTLTASNVHKKLLDSKYAAQTKVIYLGIESKDAKVKRLPVKSHFLAFSRWDKGKNPKLLLEIASSFEKLKITIAGKWTQKRDLIAFQKEVIRRKLQGQIRFITKINKARKEEIFSKSFAYIHPHFEAFGLSAMEAANHGLPVVIPSGSGITEILSNGKDGFFPKKATLGDFLPSVEKLLKKPDMAEKMGQSAQKRIQEFTWEKHVNELSKIIERVLKPKPIKTTVLETAHTSISFLAGGDILLEKLARALPKIFKVEVITTKFAASHWVGKKIYPLKTSSIEKGSNPVLIFVLYIQRVWQSIKILQRTKPDLILSTTDLLPDVLPAFFRKTISSKTKWGAWIHHLISPPHKRPGNPLVNSFALFLQVFSIFCMRLKADIIICRNRRIFSTLEKLGFAKSRLKIINTGVDFNKVNSHKISKYYNFDSLFLGRLHRLKGVFDLPEIWSEVTKAIPNAQLAIVGSNFANNKKLLEKEFKKLKLQKNITIFGTVEDEKMLDILKTSKLFLFCDYEAGFSLAAAELMSAGKPVVAYNLPIFGDIYKKGFITVPKGEKEQMAKTIITLLKNAKRRESLGKSALVQAKKLDISKTIKSFRRIINEIIAQ